MGNIRSVIVIGAGASHEAGLPVGEGLKNDISKLLKLEVSNNNLEHWMRDKTIDHSLSILESNGLHINSLHQACEHISEAMHQVISIDNFIESQKGHDLIEKCSKLGIVRSILIAERQSLLYVNLNNKGNRPTYEGFKDTWFNAFWLHMTESCQASELKNRFSNLTLIVFNYDRCIEQFLYYSFKNVYGLNNEDAAEVVNSIKIYHPYGVVGNLPWQSKEDVIAYGEEPDPYILIKLANKVKTFTEGNDPDSSEILEIKNSMLKANHVLFLGFAFHKINMQLLMPNNTENKSPENKCYFATATGISDSDTDEVKKEIRLLSKRKNTVINLRNDLKCYDIFQEYKRSLVLY